jgi:hypothetical protein
VQVDVAGRLASFIRTMRQANFRTARGHPPHDVLSVTLLLGTRQRFPAKSIASVLPLNCEIAAWNENFPLHAAATLAQAGRAAWQQESAWKAASAAEHSHLLPHN